MITPNQAALHRELFQLAVKSSYEHWHTLDECLKTFHIFSKTARSHLDKYFLLYWEPQHLLDQLEGTDKSYITKDGTRYYVIYMELLSPEYLTQYQRIRVSFRKPEFLEFGFVLVRSFKEKTPESV